MVFTRPDGSMYEIHHYLQEVDGRVTYFSGFENQQDGTQVNINGMRDELTVIRMITMENPEDI